jgi:ATP-dependent helicase/nuclease subunit A
MSSAPITPSSEQQQILYDSGNQVVLAGAGTGKTETLTQRVLHLLTSEQGGGPYELHELTVLTFTDKAAGEMRQRIYQGILHRLETETDARRRERLHRLRVNFAEQNRIGTFDSFNHRLLGLHPEQNLVPPGFQPISSYEARFLKEQLTRAFWKYAETLPATDRTALFDLLDCYERRQLIDLIEQLGREEQHHLTALLEEPNEAAFRSELETLAGLAAERNQRRQSRKLEVLWDRYEAALPDDLLPELENALRDPEPVRFKGSDVLTQKHTFAKRFVQPHLTEQCAELEATVLPLLAEWRKQEHRLRELTTALQVTDEAFARDLESRRILRQLAHFALWWSERRRELCWQHGWADFTEMQRRALELLQQNDEVSERLRRTCRHILIDEFQDTNIMQWRLVDAFRSAHNVLIVGDGKQAIYQFRGGDITVFDEVQNILLGEAVPSTLSISRRSTPAIVEFCNRLFRELLPLPEMSREPFEAAFQELASGRDDEINSGVWVVRTRCGVVDDADEENEYFEDVEEDDADEAAEDNETLMQAEAVACLLAEIQADADAGAAVRRPEWADISRRLRVGEPGVIGVLFSTHARKAVFETALREKQVRFASVKGIGFFQSEQVRDATNLACFLFDAEDSLALAGILRSPLIGLTDRALLELRIQALDRPLWQTLVALCATEGEPAQRGLFDENPLEVAIGDEADRRALCIGFSRLQRWRQAVQVQPFSEVLEAVLQETELPFYSALHSDAAQRMENWRKLIELLREREQDGWGGLRDTAEFLTAQGNEEEKEADAALPEGGSIQLMTVYAAKGLGFPMTIVAQMDTLPRQNTDLLKRGAFPRRDDVRFCVKPEDGNGRRAEPILWTILREEEQAQKEAEYRRLLYVACTRAKEHLLLVMPEQYKPESWAAMVDPFVTWLPDITLDELRRRAASYEAIAAGEPIEAAPTDSNIIEELKIAGLRQRPAVLPSELSAPELFALDIGDAADLEKLLPRRIAWKQIVPHLIAAPYDTPELEQELEQHAASLAAVYDLAVDSAILVRQVRSIRQWLLAHDGDLARAQIGVAFSIPAALYDRADLSVVEWLNGQIDLLVPVHDGYAVINFEMAGDLQAMQAAGQHQLGLSVTAATALGLEISANWLLMVNEEGQVTEVADAGCAAS